MSASNDAASQFQKRILSSITTVRQWEEDKELLRECRSDTPFDSLIPERKLRRKDTASVLAGFVRTTQATAVVPSYISEGGVGQNEKVSPYSRRDDYEKYGGDDEDEDDDVFLRRFALYFQRDVMSWVNKPACSNCGTPGDSDAISSLGTRGPQTDEEKEGDASRVEEYVCSNCNERIAFPRFNSPRAIWKSRKGRCGEYANVFGMACRSLGYDVRYVTDFTDHVWIEVWSRLQQRWIMADCCEGVIDEPSMYEVGWGKKLNYIIAITPHQVVDVTQRYSRQMHTSEFQARRRSIVPTEQVGQRIIRDINQRLRSTAKVSKGRWEEFDRRSTAEQRFFETVAESVQRRPEESQGKWITEGGGGDEYTQGRLSGSLAWRQSRQELGSGVSRSAQDSNREETKEDNDSSSGSSSSGKFQVESFLPARPPSDQRFVSIAVSTPATPARSRRQKEASSHILVSGVPCGILPRENEGDEDKTETSMKLFISIVVVDESTGCILQSRCYESWMDAAFFLDNVPDGRLVAMSASIPSSSKMPEIVSKRKMARLGGLELHPLSETEAEFKAILLLYAGQVNYNPDWATCQVLFDSKPTSINVTVSLKLTPTEPRAKKESDVKLARCEAGVVPSVIVARLPDRIMSLSRQMEASNYEKKEAFERFITSDADGGDDDDRHRYVGYCTKQGVPVYLMDNTSYPFHHHHVHDKKAATWNTYHYLPEALVDEEEEEDNLQLDESSLFDVPVDTFFFANMLGQELLRNSSTGAVERVDTASALQNSRLVALYFSAHWCGPCRRFTPMLAEMYTTLRESMPSHGFEIVFVTSDRDEHSFRQYFGTMPWLAVPYEAAPQRSATSQRYGVRGIPSLIVLDAISGEVVVPSDQSRQAVATACSNGDDAIMQMVKSDWFQRIPATSKAQMESLQEMAKSMLDKTKTKKTEKTDVSYLFRNGKENKESTDSMSSFSLGAHFDEAAVAGMKDFFSKLVAQGMDSQTAALTALIFKVGELHQASLLQDEHLLKELSPGPLNEVFWSSVICTPCVLALSTQEPTSVFNDAWLMGSHQRCALRRIQVRRCRKESGHLVIVEIRTMQSSEDTDGGGGGGGGGGGDGEWSTVYEAKDGVKIESVRMEHAATDGITSLEVCFDAENGAMEIDGANVIRVPPGFDLLGFHGAATEKEGIVSLGLVCQRQNKNAMDVEPSHNAESAKRVAELSSVATVKELKKGGRRAEMVQVATTTRKYLENLLREPWEPRFRSFRLSNAVCDTIASKADGVDFLSRIGFTLSCGPETDMVASIPIASDLSGMLQVVKDVLTVLGDEN